MITNENEKLFSDYLETLDVQYIYQPKVSILKSIGYTPDFFVLQNNSFYEVVGTRQAFSQNKRKILLAQSLVPLFIVHPDGSPYLYNQKTSSRYGKTNNDIVFRKVNILQFLEDENIPLKAFAVHCGITYQGACRMVKNSKMNRKYFNRVAERFPSILKFAYGHNDDNPELTDNGMIINYSHVKSNELNQ